MCACHQSDPEIHRIMTKDFESALLSSDSELDKQHLLLSFRKEYGWKEHHPFASCCKDGHAMQHNITLQSTPLLTFDDYKSILDTPETQKIEYKRRIFL